MVAPNTFSINQGELIIRLSSTGEILWKGKPYGINVDYVFTIPDSTDILVLLDWGATYKQGKNNLLRLDLQGNVIWEVESPPEKNLLYGPDRDDKSMEVYTDISAIDVNFVEAFAYSGYSDVIDIHTGVKSHKVVYSLVSAKSSQKSLTLWYEKDDKIQP